MEVLLGRCFVDQDERVLEMNGNPLTLREAARQALLGVFADEPNLSGEEKVKRYDLFLKLKEPDPVEMTAEEIALIKKLIAKAFATLIVGQAWRFLENKI